MSEAAAPAATAMTESGSATNAGGASPNPGSQANGAQGSATPVASQPTKTELKELGEDNMDAMVTMKVNGQIKKMSVRDALKQAELGEGAQLKMQQAAQVRKNAERLYNLAKSDPDKFFAETGIDADDYAEKRLLNKYERLAMTPEQKKNAETSEKLQRFEARETGERNQIISQIKNMADNLPDGYVKALEGATPEQLKGELQAATQRYQQQIQDIQSEFIAAWQETGLPKDTVFGTWMSSLMHSSQVQKNAGQREQALSAKDAAAIVKNNFLTAVTRITGEMDAESISRLLGTETMKKLREFDVQRVTSKAPTFEQSKNSPGTKPASSSKKNGKFVNEQGWKAAFENIS
jgi:hypothetical protein